jgi:type 1 glutamine amidotransferase
LAQETPDMPFPSLRPRAVLALTVEALPAPRWLAPLIALALMAPAPSYAEGDDGFRAIFNGRDLAGWDGDPQFWSVRDGALTGECTPERQPAHNTFCTWRDGEVDDFELRARFKIVGGSSAIQFRSLELDDFVMSGYQAGIDGADGTGAASEERGRGLLAKAGERSVIGADGKVQVVGQVGERATIIAAVHKEDWNDYTILAVGNHVVERINGVVSCDVTDEQPDKRALQGLLGLQLHAGIPHAVVQFKDIMLKRLKLSDNRRKIVLVAGKNSHGLGEHEFEAGVSAWRKCLDKVPGVVAADYIHGWPADVTAFDNADAIVFYADGGGGHPAIQGDHLQILDALARKGVGLGFSHYGVEVPKDRGGAEFQRWIGGYYEGGYSANPVWKADYEKLPDHPVTRGVKSFTTTDEWYFNIRFRPGFVLDPALAANQGIQPILVAKPSDETRRNPYSGSGPYPHIVADNGRSEVMMWVVDNPGANRGFGFTGGHYHKNWANEDQRKLLLNALLWIARAEVPPGGVVSSPSDDELNSRLRSRVAAKGASFDAKKAAYASAVVRAGTVDIDVDISGAKQLVLVVGDGGDGFACDWADWIDPVLVGPAGEVKVKDLKWQSARSGWGEVHIGKNVGGGEMKVAGKPVDGLGVHAESVIVYDIGGKGFTRFKAKGGVDNGGTDQNGGASTSVQFMVFTPKP